LATFVIFLQTILLKTSHIVPLPEEVYNIGAFVIVRKRVIIDFNHQTAHVKSRTIVVAYGALIVDALAERKASSGGVFLGF
jgi:hypothetical protein